MDIILKDIDAKAYALHCDNLTGGDTYSRKFNLVLKIS